MAKKLRRRLGAQYAQVHRAVTRPRGRQRITGIVEDVEAYVRDELGEPQRFTPLHAGGPVERRHARTVQVEHEGFLQLRHHVHPPAFRVSLPGASVAGDVPLVLTPDRRGVLASALDREQYDKNPALGKRLHPPRRLEGRHICLTSQWSRNFFHWMNDILPRLALIDEQDLRELPVIVLSDLEPASYESLERLGIGRSRLVDFDGSRLEVDELVLPSLAGRVGNQPGWALEWLRDNLAPAPAPAPKRRRLYVSRADATWRAVLNEREVFATLEKRGFEKIVPGTLPLAEQHQAFADAEAVVGPHGAGLVNLLAARDATVVELLPDTWVNGAFYPMSVELGLDYWYVVSPGSGLHDQRVLMDDLDRTLDAAGL